MTEPVDAGFVEQTPSMMQMVMEDLALQEKHMFLDPEILGKISGPEKMAIWRSCNHRREIFNMLLSLIPDQPKLRIEIIADVLGAMSVMAGVTCEHGSCFTEENVFNSIEFWRNRLPLLDVDPDEEPGKGN